MNSNILISRSKNSKKGCEKNPLRADNSILAQKILTILIRITSNVKNLLILNIMVLNDTKNTIITIFYLL